MFHVWKKSIIKFNMLVKCLTNKTNYIGKSNHILLPLNKIKRLFCPHGWKILVMWMEYFINVTRIFYICGRNILKYFLLLTKVKFTCSQVHSSHSHNSNVASFYIKQILNIFFCIQEIKAKHKWKDVTQPSTKIHCIFS